MKSKRYTNKEKTVLDEQLKLLFDDSKCCSWPYMIDKLLQRTHAINHTVEHGAIDDYVRDMIGKTLKPNNLIHYDGQSIPTYSLKT
jgi:hypothetical protein